MSNIVAHVERKSRFLRTLIPSHLCYEEIRFGMVDCLTIGLTLASFVGLVCVLAG